MKMDSHTKHAMTTGRQQATKVLAVRDQALKKRAAALRKRSAVSEEPRASISPKLLKAAGGPGKRGVLVAEGDSWFDYPGKDILAVLEDDHGFDVADVAGHGHRIQDMAYNDGHLEDFTREIEKVIRRGDMPKAILLSGGGNDIAGKEFEVLLNHISAPNPGLNPAMVEEIINQQIKHAYVTIITSVTEVCKKRLGQAIPILVHGYDYAVADGRGFLLYGPWLEPGFRERGYLDLEQRKAIVQDLIDRFNTMLTDLRDLPQFEHVTYVNIRNTLPNDKSYKRWWANELHPTRKGWGLVAQQFAAAI
jgi:hypothetical protein